MPLQKMEVVYLFLIKYDLGQCYHLNVYIFCLRTIIAYTVKPVKPKDLKSLMFSTAERPG